MMSCLLSLVVSSVLETRQRMNESLWKRAYRTEETGPAVKVSVVVVKGREEYNSLVGLIDRILISKLL